MSLLNMLLDAQGGQGLSHLAKEFGLDEAKAGGLAGLLAPAIAQGAKKRAEAGGADTVLNALKGEAEGVYMDDSVAAARPEGRAQGENFLDSILGSRDASHSLASEAANQTGIDLATVMKFLPAIAAMLQGGMQRRLPDSAIDNMLQGSTPTGADGGLMGMVGGLLGGGGAGASGGGLDMLNQMLDADGDGSALDDILDRFLKR